MTCASVVGTCAATLVLSAGTAAAAPRVVPLPTPLQRLSTQPPLQGETVIAPEGLRHRVRVVERVNVDVDARGVPFAVVLVDRLTVLDKGDYNFAIPAPVVDVRAAAGSASQPGQRAGAILWAGFNPRRKVLAAQARLRTSDAAPFLPLRIQIDQFDSRTRVMLLNATAVAATVVDAAADPVQAGHSLEEVRSAVAGKRPLFIGGGVAVRGAQRFVRRLAEAPLRVTGTISTGRTSRTVDVTLGDTLPLRGIVELRGVGRVRLRLTVEPVPPVRTLTPPRGTRWAESGLDGRSLLRRATDALLRIARLRQYDSFVDTPDPRSEAQTTYVYRVAARPGLPRAAVGLGNGEGNGGNGTPLWVGLGLLVAAAVAFAWTRT